MTEEQKTRLEELKTKSTNEALSEEEQTELDELVKLVEEPVEEAVSPEVPVEETGGPASA